MVQSIQELEQERDSIHFYDKITNKIILIHTHCEKDETHPAGFVPVDATDANAQSIIDQMVVDGAYEFVLDKLTDNDLINLGYVLSNKRQAQNSFLHIEIIDGTPTLMPKFYLDLSLISTELATLLEDDDNRKRQLWSFDSDGSTPLRFSVECRQPADTNCVRCPDTSTKLTDKTNQIKVEVSHGRTNPKDGVYTLVDGECEIEWVLPDESIEEAKIWVRDLSKDFLNSEFRTSNTLKVRCY